MKFKLYLGIFGGLVAATFIGGVTYAAFTGPVSNVVPVDVCYSAGKNAITVRRFGAVYRLNPGCYDAGHGKRNYVFRCVAPNRYQVQWTSCGNSTPTPTPTPAPTPTSAPVNTKPVITLSGGTANLFVGDAYVAPTATAVDAEDGNITFKIQVSGTVNTQTAGTYQQTFNVVDSRNLAADAKTFTVVVTAKPQAQFACSSHSDCNDNVAHTVDWCHSPNTADAHCHNDVIQCSSNSQCQPTTGLTGYTCGTPFGASAPKFCTK